MGGALAGIAFAQDPAALDAESQRQHRRAQERAQVEAERHQRPVDVRLPNAPPAIGGLRFPDKEEPCFLIHELKVESGDAPRHDWSWLRAELDQPPGAEPALGRCLGAEGIGVVLARLQQAIVSRGWITTRVMAPPQDLNRGELRVRVHEGVVSQIRFADRHGDRGSLFNTLPVRAGDVLNLRDLEQGLENLRRVPTVYADIAVEPGGEPGHSELVVRHEQAFPLRFHVSLDDSGQPSTGTYQGALTVSVDNPLALSDLFYVTAHGALGGRSSGPRGNSGYAAHYSVPHGHNLWSFNTSRSQYRQTVAGAQQDYTYRGRSQHWDVRLSRLVQRNQQGKTTAAVRGFHRQSRNFIDDTEVEVQRRAVSGVDLSVGHRRSAGTGHWEAQLTHRQGIKAWGALPAPEEGFGEGTAQMRLWLLDAQLSQAFEIGGQRWTYQAQLRRQWHQTPLTPQDRMAIGGRYTVRGFDGNQSLTGDSGTLLRQEVATPLGSSPFSAYAGVDWGRVSGPAAERLVGRELMGGVLGLRAHGQAGRIQTHFDLFVGKPLKQPNGFATAQRVVGFTLNAQF